MSSFVRHPPLHGDERVAFPYYDKSARTRCLMLVIPFPPSPADEDIFISSNMIGISINVSSFKPP